MRYVRLMAIAMCLVSVTVVHPTHNSERIWMKFPGRVGNGPGTKCLKFDGDWPTGRYSKPVKCTWSTVNCTSLCYIVTYSVFRPNRLWRFGLFRWRRRPPSVRPSAVRISSPRFCDSRVLKRLKVGWRKQRRMIAQGSCFMIPEIFLEIRTGSPPTGAPNADGVRSKLANFDK